MSHQQTIEKIKKYLSEDVFVIDALRDTFKGKTALVISAGPSAENWKEIYEKEKHNDPVIICIKQTLNLIDIPCDIHILNSANLIKYKYQPNTLSVITRNSMAAPVFGKYDVVFRNMEGFSYRHKYYLVNSKFFECYTLEKTGVYRPIGPGIMHESVLYLLIHMGFKKIVTCGWDIADSKGGNTHVGDIKERREGVIYQPGKPKKIFMEILDKIYLLGFFKYLNIKRKYMMSLYKYYTGMRINGAGMEPGEAEMVAQSIPELKAWLKLKGIELKIHSNSRWMNK